MAFGVGTISSIGGAVNDLFSSGATASGLRLKAQGNRVEAENYDLAAGLSKENAEFTRQSTAIKGVMADRQIMRGMGTLATDVAGSGFSNSGSALDLMRSSASEGALQKQVLGQQGLITEAGYNEQTKSYNNLAGYARYAAGVQDDMADKASSAGGWSAAFKGAAGVASLFTGGFDLSSIFQSTDDVLPGGAALGQGGIGRA